MNKGFVGGCGILLVFLLMASFSANIVLGKDNSLDGNILTLHLDPKTSYKITIEGTNLSNEPYTSDSDGAIAIDLGNFSPPDIKYFVKNQNDTEILNQTLNNKVAITSFDGKKGKVQQTEVTNTSPVLTDSSQDLTNSASAKNSEDTSTIFGFKQIYFIIFGVFLIVFVAAWYLYRATRDSDDQPNSKLNELSQLPSNFRKLKVELIDESGIRLSDKVVKVIAKNNPVPQGSSRSDINGECTFDLFKGKYTINAEGEEKYDSIPKEINLKSDENIQLILTGRQPLQIELVDESGTPLRDIEIRVLEHPAFVDIVRQSPKETDNYGIAKFYISKNKQYVASVQSLKGEFIKQEKIPINNLETTKRIKLIKRAGTLEVTVAEQSTGRTFAGIPVTVTKKGTGSINEFMTDDAGKINQKIPVGDYMIRLKPGSFPLYESGEKYTTIIENRLSKIILDFRFNYQAKPQDKQLNNTIREKLETSYKEVSAYDACIPLFFKRVGEKPTQLVENITKRPVEFLGAKTSPDEIIPYILKTAEFIAGEISRIMREKSNVDFYYSIQNLEPVNDDLNVSDYSQDKFRELVHDIENYHKNHKTEIGNKLHEIDAELTKLSGDLTIQPVADLWRVAQKLQDNSINESDLKKRGVMLFLNDKLLDHVREMYNKDEVKARLKFSMV